MAEGAPSEPDVFLSYAREDEARAHELATALGQRGVSVFWDREIPPGQTWHSHVGEALAEARCVVVAWSSHSIASDWVIEEANEGKRRRILVPVLFDAVQPPFGFGGIQAASLIDWRPDEPSPALDTLMRAVQRIVGGQVGSGIEAPPELRAMPRRAPAEPAPESKPLVRPPTQSPLSSEAPAAWASPPKGSPAGRFGRTAIPMLAGLVTLVGVGGMVWWLMQREPTGPTAVPPAPGKSIAEPKASEPLVETAPAPAPEQPLAASTETGERDQARKDCPECPEIVLVPPGEFAIGSPPDEPGRDDDEGPQRTVTLAAPIWVGKYEVTFAEWGCLPGRGRMQPQT